MKKPSSLDVVSKAAHEHARAKVAAYMQTPMSGKCVKVPAVSKAPDRDTDAEGFALHVTGGSEICA